MHTILSTPCNDTAKILSVENILLASYGASYEITRNSPLKYWSGRNETRSPIIFTHNPKTLHECIRRVGWQRIMQSWHLPIECWLSPRNTSNRTEGPYQVSQCHTHNVLTFFYQAAVCLLHGLQKINEGSSLHHSGFQCAREIFCHLKKKLVRHKQRIDKSFKMEV